MNPERKDFESHEVEPKYPPVHWQDRTPEDKKEWIAKAYTVHGGKDISCLYLGHLTQEQIPDERHYQMAEEMFEHIDKRINGILERYRDSTEIHAFFPNADYISTEDPTKNNNGFEILLPSLMFALGIEKEEYEKLTDPDAIRDVVEKNNLHSDVIQKIANLTNKGVLMYSYKESSGEYIQMGGVAPNHDRVQTVVEAEKGRNFIVYKKPILEDL